MRIITTIADLTLLRQIGLFPKALADYLQQEFVSLYHALSHEDEDVFQWSLVNDGYIVILEKGDQNLQPVGLAQDLCSVGPEYVEIIQLKHVKFYKIMFYLDNDFSLFVYSQVGTHTSEIETWLRDMTEQSERGN